MKKTIYLKSIFLLCLLLAGAVNAHADDYEWVKVTDLDDVDDPDDLLAKPTTIYVAWDDDDLEI